LCKYATDWLLTVSEEDAQFAGDKGFLRKDRIVCIGNGVEIDKYTKSFPRKEIRDSLGIAEDEKVIGFIGRIVREKGVVDLARAYLRVLERFPEARLLVIGETLPSDRDKKAKQMLEGFITENNLDNKVIFTGFRDDIPELLSIMDVFVLPSYREGMPNTILEAMASGKPVIATNIRGCREEVINERTGLLVERSDVDGLAKAILGIISNTDLAKAMGEKGKERAFAKYNEDEMVRKQLDIYWRIIEEVKHKDGQPVK
jgi:glycosyltransferase involved in cell wall biosynthesis